MYSGEYTVPCLAAAVTSTNMGLAWVSGIVSSEDVFRYEGGGGRGISAGG